MILASLLVLVAMLPGATPTLVTTTEQPSCPHDSEWVPLVDSFNPSALSEDTLVGQLNGGYYTLAGHLARDGRPGLLVCHSNSSRMDNQGMVAEDQTSDHCAGRLVYHLGASREDTHQAAGREMPSGYFQAMVVATLPSGGITASFCYVARPPSARATQVQGADCRRLVPIFIGICLLLVLLTALVTAATVRGRG